MTQKPLMSIKPLSADTIDKIAAGEVIESPVSVVKELVENSLDAGSSKIMVTLMEGGKDLIKISDDGTGISADNLTLAWTRHATSKIRRVEDLFSIRSMGFRGEALSSIAAVAELQLETKSDSENIGNHVTISGGRELERVQISRSSGTTISVKNLFHHVPVRKKFLGSSASEVRKILKLVSKIALSNPDVTFKVISDKRILINYVKGSLENRAAQVFGQGLFKEMVPVHWETNNYCLSGFIGLPEHTKGRSTNQYFFVNNRNIHSAALIRAFGTGYSNLQMGKFPIGVLNLNIPPEEVDINVHPTKKEVRFSNDAAVFQLVSSGVRKALQNALDIPAIQLGKSQETESQLIYPENPVQEFKFEKVSTLVEEVQDNKKQLDLLSEELKDNSSEPLLINWPKENNSKKDEIEKPEPRAIPYFQLHKNYILFEVRSGLMVVNQYFAHQRILYEEAMEVIKSSGKLSSQQLLFPEIVDLDSTETHVLTESMKYFQGLGFDMEHFGGETFQIRGIPAEISQSRTIEVIKKMVQSLMESGKLDPENLYSTIAKAYAKGACIPSGDELGYEKMENLINRLFATQNPFVSPFGKPVVVRYLKEEIDRRFGH